MSIFLTETDTRHSLLHKTKLFRDKLQTRLTSNSTKLMGASQDEAIDVDGAYPQGVDIPIRREDDDDDANLADIPMADDADETPARPESTNRRPKRRRDPRGHGHDEADRASGVEGASAHVEVIDSDSSGNELFVDDDEGGSSEESEDGSDDSDDADTRQPPSKRRKETAGDAAPERDDKKKMALDISYEGFAIYGRVLCLVVKRRGDGGGGAKGGGTSSVPSGSNKPQTAAGRPGGQAMLENWIASTQLPDPAAEDAEGE